MSESVVKGDPVQRTGPSLFHHREFTKVGHERWIGREREMFPSQLGTVWTRSADRGMQELEWIWGPGNKGCNELGGHWTYRTQLWTSPSPDPKNLSIHELPTMADIHNWTPESEPSGWGNAFKETIWSLLSHYLVSRGVTQSGPFRHVAMTLSSFKSSTGLRATLRFSDYLPRYKKCKRKSYRVPSLPCMGQGSWSHPPSVARPVARQAHQELPPKGSLTVVWSIPHDPPWQVKSPIRTAAPNPRGC